VSVTALASPLPGFGDIMPTMHGTPVLVVSLKFPVLEGIVPIPWGHVSPAPSVSRSPCGQCSTVCTSLTMGSFRTGLGHLRLYCLCSKHTVGTTLALPGWWGTKCPSDSWVSFAESLCPF
jgi:hypothetical protein